MENGLKKLPDYYNITPKEVAKFIKNFIKDLQDKYNNLQGIDKVITIILKIIDTISSSLSR